MQCHELHCWLLDCVVCFMIFSNSGSDAIAIQNMLDCGLDCFMLILAYILLSTVLAICMSFSSISQLWWILSAEKLSIFLMIDKCKDVVVDSFNSELLGFRL